MKVWFKTGSLCERDKLGVVENLDLIDATGSKGGVKNLSFGLPAAAISHVSDISLQLWNGRALYWGSTCYITCSCCLPHCSLCSVSSMPPYYLPVCLFIHLSIPCHNQTLSAAPAVSTAHFIFSWLNSSPHFFIPALLSIYSCKLFDFYYVPPLILSISCFMFWCLTTSEVRLCVCVCVHILAEDR